MTQHHMHLIFFASVELTKVHTSGDTEDNHSRKAMEALKSSQCYMHACGALVQFPLGKSSEELPWRHLASEAPQSFHSQMSLIYFLSRMSENSTSTHVETLLTLIQTQEGF